jgi:serine/threonine protein kinase
LLLPFITLLSLPRLKNSQEDRTGEKYLDQVRSITQQILLALYYLRRNKVIHGDLRPENILLRREGFIARCCACEEGTQGGRRGGQITYLYFFTYPYLGNKLVAKLSDFGNAVRMVDVAMHYYGDFQIQSPLYRAPEVKPSSA